MTTYLHKTKKEGLLIRYYYDPYLRLWAMYEIDEEGNQISREAWYYPNKKEMLKYYPYFKFKKEVEK